jgi:hypothetical protein
LGRGAHEVGWADTTNGLEAAGLAKAKWLLGQNGSCWKRKENGPVEAFGLDWKGEEDKEIAAELNLTQMDFFEKKIQTIDFQI